MNKSCAFLPDIAWVLNSVEKDRTAQKEKKRETSETDFKQNIQ